MIGQRGSDLKVESDIVIMLPVRAVGVVAVVATKMFVLVGDVVHELTASHFNAGMSW